MQADVVSQLPPFTSCTPVCLKFPLPLRAITIVKQPTQLLQFSLQVFMASNGSCHLLRRAHQHCSHHKPWHTRECSLIIEWLTHERCDLTSPQGSLDCTRRRSLHRLKSLVGQLSAFTSGVSSFTLR